MTYEETLEWMFSRLPMYQKEGKSAYSAKLDNIQAFVRHLGHPERKFKSIHVAGTNGKGSCSHMLASVLQEAGYRTGLYTSPHLLDFRERIRIDGQTISEEGVTTFIRENREFIEANQLSFFELTVAMAFDHFARSVVDVAVIEVGLGGKLDSTNIIFPEIALITNIGMDHTDMLGDTLEAITLEKAGIIKPGIPVVISEWQPETAPIFAHVAASMGAPLNWAEELVEESYPCGLSGSYQQRNVKGVVATLRALPGFEVSEDQLCQGLEKVVENTGLRGRWQVLQENPKVICDTAHNREGLSLAMAQLEKEQAEQLHMVVGFVRDKDILPMLALLPGAARYYFCKPDIPRGLEVDPLMEQATGSGIEGTAYPSVEAALKAALEVASDQDVVYIGGSTFTVAEALRNFF